MSSKTRSTPEQLQGNPFAQPVSGGGREAASVHRTHVAEVHQGQALKANQIRNVIWSLRSARVQLVVTADNPRVLSAPILSGEHLKFTVLTPSGKTYTVEVKSDLSEDSWVPTETFQGNGTPRIPTLPTSKNAGFNRLKIAP